VFVRVIRGTPVGFARPPARELRGSKNEYDYENEHTVSLRALDTGAVLARGATDSRRKPWAWAHFTGDGRIRSLAAARRIR
jgi:hypothetical protein